MEHPPLSKTEIAISILVICLFVSLVFFNVNAAPLPKVSLTVTRLDFNNGYWNYRADYNLKNLSDGSLSVNGAMFVNNIKQSGSAEVGYAMKPGRKYTFTFYSRSGGRGRIMASRAVVAPKAPRAVKT